MTINIHNTDTAQLQVQPANEFVQICGEAEIIRDLPM